MPYFDPQENSTHICEGCGSGYTQEWMDNEFEGLCRDCADEERRKKDNDENQDENKSIRS
jgi:hypothetical protein